MFGSMRWFPVNTLLKRPVRCDKKNGLRDGRERPSSANRFLAPHDQVTAVFRGKILEKIPCLRATGNKMPISSLHKMVQKHASKFRAEENTKLQVDSHSTKTVPLQKRRYKFYGARRGEASIT